MLNRNIKSFIISGVIKDDSKISKARENYERLLLQDMRDKGYVPVLDLESQFSIKYNENKDSYSFFLEMFGVYLGKKKAQEVEGFSGQQFFKRITMEVISPPPAFNVKNFPHFFPPAFVKQIDK
ncbi:MAG: hypothetical protein RLZZ196_85 [Bacteroidota bacterium]|jgi:hypothetical protein